VSPSPQGPFLVEGAKSVRVRWGRTSSTALPATLKSRRAQPGTRQRKDDQARTSASVSGHGATAGRREVAGEELCIRPHGVSASPAIKLRPGGRLCAVLVWATRSAVLSVYGRTKRRPSPPSPLGEQRGSRAPEGGSWHMRRSRKRTRQERQGTVTGGRRGAKATHRSKPPCRRHGRSHSLGVCTASLGAGSLFDTGWVPAITRVLTASPGSAAVPDDTYCFLGTEPQAPSRPWVMFLEFRQSLVELPDASALQARAALFVVGLPLASGGFPRHCSARAARFSALPPNPTTSAPPPRIQRQPERPSVRCCCTSAPDCPDETG